MLHSIHYRVVIYKEGENVTINYAHRGASGYYPENTLISFEKAIEMSCGGIETDVQLTKDGVLVLIHDEKINRTTNGTGWIKDYSYKKLSKLDAGSWMSKEFHEERIPTAEELISLVKSKDIIINFELKNGIVHYEGMEEKIIDLIHKHNMQNKVILSSFNHYSMVKCKEICREIKTGVLYEESLYKPYAYAKTTRANAIHPNYNVIDEEIVRESKAAGIDVNIYTVNDEKHMRQFVNMKVDGIITNYPDKLHKILNR